MTAAPEHLSGPAGPERQPATAGPSAAPGPRRGPSAVPTAGPARILALQRAAGNRAVAASLQRVSTTPAAASRPATLAPAAPAAAGPATAPALDQAEAPMVPTGATGDAVVQRDLLDDIGDAVGSVAGGVKDRVLGFVRDRARSFPGYSLLTVVLGKDPITDAPVERNAAALISGFLDIIPGSDRIRGPLQESRAIEKAGAWFDQEVPKLGISFDSIKGLFSQVVNSFGPEDLLDIPAAVGRVMRIFGAPIQRIRTFAVGAAKTLMEFIVEGAMSLAGGAGGQVMAIIRRAGGAFDRIVADPMGFLSNLVNAAKGGFMAFASNVGTHLRNGLIGWLTGSLGGVIRIPERFDLRGILGMAMDFLGLTWERVRGRLTRLIPEPVLRRLEQAAGLVADLHQRGLAAITDRIGQFTEGIIDTVLGGIREWVTNNVVTQAITRIVSMFNPAGAIVQAAIAIYNTVQFFIERGRQIAALGEAIFDSIEAIASGSIGGAVQKVEQALGRAVPVLLGFLARLLGLGDIATPVRNVMQRVHTVIDSAIDRVLGWVAGIARRAAGALGIGGRRDGAQQPPAADLQPALRDAQSLLGARGATVGQVTAALPALRERHSLRTAALHPAPGAPGSYQVLVQRAETAPVALGGAEEFALPPGGQSIEDRRAAGGNPPQWAIDNAPRAFYDTQRHCYAYRPGAGPGTTELEHYRPGFRDTTLEELASPAGPYGHLHSPGGTNVQSGMNRRHIAAYEQIRSELLRRLSGLSTVDALIQLNNLGHPPAQDTPAAIDAAARAYLRERFNDYRNLWVGEAEENQEKGRQIAVLRQRLEAKQRELAALPAGSGAREGVQAEIASLQQQLDQARHDPEPAQ